MSRTRQHHAVVIGAGMGGLTAARMLADHFERVTILDRDQLPDAAQPRNGAPQGRHAHALLAGGARAIAQLFPEIMAEMVESGATLIDFNEGIWHQAGGYRAQSLIERKVIGGSRPFIEGHVRRRTAQLPNVTIETGVAVSGLTHDGLRVRGVCVQHGDVIRTLRADLVIDCSGRGSRVGNWLQQIGYDAPALDEVTCDVRYSTMVLHRSPGDIDGAFAVIIESPPHGKRAAFLIPVEGERWIATIASTFGAPTPTDPHSFAEVAASLPSPELHQALQVARQLTDVMTHRLPTSRRRRFEKQRRVPAGFVALGDSICSFNPIYGQGMSSAVMQAVELGACLVQHGNSHRLAPAFYKRAAKVIDTPWQIAVGADFAYPECEGPKPAGTDLVNAYMRRVLVAAHVSPEVNTAMILVQNLLAPPKTLLKPKMIATVLRAARRARDDARTPTKSKMYLHAE